MTGSDSRGAGPQAGGAPDRLADIVAEAVEIVAPYAVDVASGVEAEPGVKDHAKMAAFYEAANSVGAAT